MASRCVHSRSLPDCRAWARRLASSSGRRTDCSRTARSSATRARTSGSAVDAGVVYVFPPSEDSTARPHGRRAASRSPKRRSHVTPHGRRPVRRKRAASRHQRRRHEGPDHRRAGPQPRLGRGVRDPCDERTAPSYDSAHRIVLQQGTAASAGSSEVGRPLRRNAGARRRRTTSPWFAIGAPGEDVGSTVDAGDVVIDAARPRTRASLTVYPGHGAPGTPQAGDHFGAALSPLLYALAVGLPGHNVGSADRRRSSRPARTDGRRATRLSRAVAPSTVDRPRREPRARTSRARAMRSGRALTEG